MGKRVLIALVAVLIACAGVTGFLAFRSLVTELSVSTATDVVVQAVNGIVKDIMRRGGGDGLVTLQKNAAGEVTAVTTNVAAVNTLAAEVLERTVEKTQDNALEISVPLGSVLGLRVLSVPVEVRMLSSSGADFRSELESAGINQTRHRIVLSMRVDVSLFMPWRIVGTSVETEILVSETVIVGQVPQNFLEWTE